MDEYYGSYPVGPNRRQVILRLAIGVAALLIIGAIIIWLVFFHHKSPDITSKVGKVETSQQESGKSTSGSSSTTSPHKSSGSSSSQNESGNSSANPSSGTSSTGSSSTSSDSSKSASNPDSTPPTTSNSTDQSDDLSQTGPGGLISLFAVTVVLTAGLRRLQLSRR